MKQLVMGVLLAALLSLGYRLAATMIVEAGDAPAPTAPEQQLAPKDSELENPTRADAVPIDWAIAERNLAHNHAMGASMAKPIHGPKPADLATARTLPAAAPEPRIFGPEGIVYHRVSSMPSTASALRMTPPPADEPLVQALPEVPTLEPVSPLVRDDRTMSPEPLPPTQAVVTPAHGRMIGPDGIEFHAVKSAH